MRTNPGSCWVPVNSEVSIAPCPLPSLSTLRGEEKTQAQVLTEAGSRDHCGSSVAPKADKCSGFILILVFPTASWEEREEENSENRQTRLEFPDPLFPLCFSYHWLKQWFISPHICLNMSPYSRLGIIWEHWPHLSCSPLYPWQEK